MSTLQISSTSRRSAFTIIEILVTIGILVLIAAGMSTIFTSISETVNAGKRVAELNRFAAQFERVMRQDFESMTRDGFLVIVHQNAPGANPTRDVQLSPADASDLDNNGVPGRPRRADEIMFFSRSQYETTRRAISPGMIAKSTEAAIYYGHGQKRRPDFTRPFNNPVSSNNFFFNPAINDQNIDQSGPEQAWLGTPSTDGIPNPNRYAVDWSLLRQVTLLTNPQTSGQDLPDELFNVRRLGDRPWLEDSARQVALQPAMQTIFGSLNFYQASATMPRWFKEYRPGGFIAATDSEIYRASGLVDLVTSDINSIASAIRYGPGVGGWLGSPLDYLTPTGFNDFKTKLDLGAPQQITIDPVQFSNPSSPFSQQRLWMLDALPSRWDISNLTQLSRVRYEDIPTRLLYDQGTFANDRDRIYAEADQEMLGSSVFIPKCTEFTVEWSMGYIDQSITSPTDPNYKRMLWYGLHRGLDANDNGTLDPGELHYADRYTPRPAIGLSTEQIARESLISQLVMGHAPGTQFDTEISMFAFEYSNPAIADNPDTPQINESIDQWPWPKFIRITLSIADPTDNTIEQTFQMVFDIQNAMNN